MWQFLRSFAVLALFTGIADAENWSIESPFWLEIETSPTPITPADIANAHIDFSTNSEGFWLGGFHVGTTFDTEVAILEREIVISINVIPPPPLGEGEVGLPSFFHPSFDVLLGTLPPGAFQMHATVTENGQLIGRGDSTLTVVPEPKSVLLAFGGMLLFGTVGCRLPR